MQASLERDAGDGAALQTLVFKPAQAGVPAGANSRRHPLALPSSLQLAGPLLLQVDRSYDDDAGAGLRCAWLPAGIAQPAPAAAPGATTARGYAANRRWCNCLPHGGVCGGIVSSLLHAGSSPMLPAARRSLHTKAATPVAPPDTLHRQHAFEWGATVYYQGHGEARGYGSIERAGETDLDGTPTWYVSWFDKPSQRLRAYKETNLDLALIPYGRRKAPEALGQRIVVTVGNQKGRHQHCRSDTCTITH